tara:strand:- start:61 stop:879 length:819 start_codon:yes stop_codon:yes gene_type:complete
MNLVSIINQIKLKKSFLCVGLDPDLDLLPKHLLKYNDPIFEFNKSIIDATADLCVAYKPNLAFYEKLGPNGLSSLKKTIEYIPSHHFVIADAKRSDILNTAKMYADTFYNYYNCDAVTLSAYMGKDSLVPFLSYNKWVILLIATSNPSAHDLQNLELNSGVPLYLELVKKAKLWSSYKNTMFVVGATRPNELRLIRKLAPDYFFLVPGVGFQGGDIDSVVDAGFNQNCGLIVNISRSILYADGGLKFDKYARKECLAIQSKMELILRTKSFI